MVRLGGGSCGLWMCLINKSCCYGYSEIPFQPWFAAGCFVLSWELALCSLRRVILQIER
jgi:hypothetical protein